MMRAIALRSGSQYYHYLERETVEEAYWQGRGAELLQLEWEGVRAKEFADLTARIDPKTQESLKQWNGQQVTLIDAIVHAPKSISILGLLDDRLAASHRIATLQLMDAMQRQSAVWANGGNRQTNNLIMAPFEHRQSRAGDAHLHTHIAVINMSYDHEVGRWKALRAEPIFYNRHELTEGYRTTLARRVEQLGYEIRDRQKVGFEVAGVPEQVIERFSTRSQEIKEKLKESDFRITFENVGRWTRGEKGPLVSPPEFREQQLARMTDREQQTVRETVDRAQSYRHKIRLDVADGEEHGQKHRLTYESSAQML